MFNRRKHIGLDSGFNSSPLAQRRTSGGFTPAELNPVLWLETGNDNYTLDGSGNISNWTASIGTSLDQTVVLDRPSPQTLSGASFVLFEKTTLEHLNMNNTYQSMYRGSFTKYFIFKPNVIGTSSRFLFGHLDSTQTKLVYVMINTNGTFTVWLRNGVLGTLVKAKTVEVLSTANTYIVEINHDIVNKQINIYINGVLAALDGIENGDTTAINMTTYTNPVPLFMNARNFNGSDGLYGDNSFGDVLFFDKLLTPTQRTSLGNYYV